jgi:hypothetical protein
MYFIEVLELIFFVMSGGYWHSVAFFFLVRNPDLLYAVLHAETLLAICTESLPNIKFQSENFLLPNVVEK